MTPFLKRFPVTGTLVIVNLSIHFNLYLTVLFEESAFTAIEQIYRRYGLVASQFYNEGFYWQPLTSMFMHGFVEQAALMKDQGESFEMFKIFFSWGLIHVGVNMIALFSIGQVIERVLGSFRMAALYLISGLAGGFGVLLQSNLPDLPTVGASGAISGLVGALVVLYPASRLLLFFVIPVRAKSLGLGFAIISLLLIIFSEPGVVSHVGHLGGLCGGFIFTVIAVYRFARNEGLSPDLLLPWLPALREFYLSLANKSVRRGD